MKTSAPIFMNQYSLITRVCAIPDIINPTQKAITTASELCRLHQEPLYLQHI